MAQFNYEEMQAVADELISEFGAAATLYSVDAPDPVEGGEPVPVAHPCRAVSMAFDQRYINGTTILEGDVQLFISAIGLEVEPEVGMAITVGSMSYLIVSIDPNRFDGQTPVVYAATGRTAS